MELSKYIKSESVELNRSAIRFADYNPRKLSDESRKALKRGIKKFGLVGGIVVNKRTGLTDADLNMIGVDFLLQTEEESSIADELESMMSPVTEQKEADKAAKQLERAEKVAHMKEVKHQVKENAQKQAENMDAYVMLSFDTYEAKAAFCERFGYEPDMKFIKGEVFDEQVERID